MSELDDKASQLGRILTAWQITANNGMPGIVLMAQLEIIHRLAGELITELAKDPSTTVHVNPELSDGAATMLSDYFQGHTHIPDTLEGLD
jgi:hypothetical protein